MKAQSRICFFVVLVAGFVQPVEAFCWTHIAHSGETLEQLAVRYYGSPQMSMVIRAANGFVHPDDGSVTPGEQIEIPEVTYHRVGSDETWKSIANQYLASPKRGIFLAKMNGYDKNKFPAKGTIIKIPYHLRHIFAVGETIRSVVRLYYGKTRTISWLKQYNVTRKTKFTRGDVVIVPLIKLGFTEQEQRRIQTIRSERYSEKDIEAQDEAREAIGELRKSFEQGQYIRIVAIAYRLIGKGKLTVPQQIGVHKYLGFAYVALGKEQRAIEAFTKAIVLQPAMELSTITTSPKILKVFHEAKNKFREMDSAR
ncbi:MAG: LysM peptidoglycan-binding domain-containing protein [Proteobacteria bacterium]|nr:LysM peptidoglycan-binding domain-containing protein [Pseudomonadota bacterium]